LYFLHDTAKVIKQMQLLGCVTCMLEWGHVKFCLENLN